MPYYATVKNPKLRTYLGRAKMASGEIDTQRHKFWQSIEFFKVYMQNTYR